MLPSMSVHGPLGATPQSGAVELRAPALDSRRVPSSVRLAPLGIVGLLLSGLVISVSAAQTDSLVPETVRPVPSWLAGAFGTSGPNLHVVGLIAVLALMTASYVIVAQAADRLSARVVLMAIAALHAFVLLAPPLISTDVFSYQAYGRMGALYGANPYLYGPHAIALDPVYPLIGAKWVTIPSAYGPLFTTLSYVLAPLTIAASVLAYKAIAAVASLVTVALIWNAARLRGLDPVKAAALVGLNPLVVVYGVGGGHNDLLMLALMSAALFAMLQHRERSAGGLTMAAVGVKLTAGLFLPFAAAAEGRNRGHDRRRDVLLGAAAGAVLLAILGFGMFGSGPLHLLATLHKSQAEGDWHSIPGFISTRLGLPPIGQVAGLVLALLFVVAFWWLLRRVWRGEMDWIDGAGWATAAMIVTASSLLPWYVAWLMPLAALASDHRLWRTAIYLTVFVQAIQMLGYIPHGSSVLGL
jgi:alpha-1,6-mannosyltransferase